MKRKILRSLWLIPLIAGICLGIAGITKINKAKNIYVPEMGEEGWFDASSEQNHAKSIGFVMVFVGFGFLSIVSLAVGIIVKQATATPEELAESTTKVLDKNNRFKEKLEELVGKEALNEYNNNTYTDNDAEDSEENDNDLGLDDIGNPFLRIKKLHKSASSSSANKIKYCSFCGSANTGNATKCSSCGAGFSKK